MYFYEVRYEPDLDIPYPCGPQPDPETAILHFNSNYGSKLGLAFTTEVTGSQPSDHYILVEQARGLGIGLHDLRTILVYKSNNIF